MTLGAKSAAHGSYHKDDEIYVSNSSHSGDEKVFGELDNKAPKRLASKAKRLKRRERRKEKKASGQIQPQNTGINKPYPQGAIINHAKYSLTDEMYRQQNNEGGNSIEKQKGLPRGGMREGAYYSGKADTSITH